MSPGLTDSEYRGRIHGKPRRMVPNPSARRFALWIDGVGSYLACWSAEVMIGQAGGENVDVPLVANVARRHCRLIRDQGGYALEALGPVQVQGRAVQGSVSLVSGDELRLGENVALRFVLPHPLSRTARLELSSHHRTQPLADALLLFSETCVLGARPSSHVVCGDWSGEVVLYRQQQRLWCRSAAPLEIDGRLVESGGELGPNSRVVGCDFSFSVEWL